MPSYLKPSLRESQPYKGGLQPKDSEEWIKLNTNESPYPPSPRVIDALHAAIGDSLRLYPAPWADEAAAALAAAHGLEPSWVRLGNGADELIEMCFQAFAAAGERVAFTWPTYPVMEPLCAVHETVASIHPLGEGWSLPASFAADEARLKFLVNPNSPTGTWYGRAEVETVVGSARGVMVLDEAYADFAPESRLDLLADHPNLLLLRTMSKSYALAGMRIGFAFGHPELLEQLDAVKDFYNLDRLAIVAARAAAEDKSYRDRLVSRVVADREWFAAELQALDFEVSPSATNFVLTRPPEGVAARDVLAGLQERRILVRHYDRPPLEEWLRISIGSREQMAAVLKAIGEVLQQ